MVSPVPVAAGSVVLARVPSQSRKAPGLATTSFEVEGRSSVEPAREDGERLDELVDRVTSETARLW